jgi:hypothetical protein
VVEVGPHMAGLCILLTMQAIRANKQPVNLHCLVRWLVQRETNMYVMSFLEISERMSGNSDGM